MTRAVPLGYDRDISVTVAMQEAHTMGDKSPKSNAKNNKQKSQKKDVKQATTSAPAKK